MIGSKKILFLLRITAFYLLLLDVSYSWNVTSLNLSDDVLIWRFAVWKTRAFFAIPRSINEEIKEYKPTLVEVSWPEITSNWQLRVTNAAVVPFSKNRPLKYDYRERTLVSVTGLDVDARGRLWVLDAPDLCDRWPQIVIYDLKRNDRLVSFTELTGVSSNYLRALVIDPAGDQWGSRGYIADAGDETIIVYSLGNSTYIRKKRLCETQQYTVPFTFTHMDYLQIPGQGKWWRLKMLHGPEMPRVHTNDLAISRRNSVLYMTGHNTHDLFSINLDEVKAREVFWTASHEIQNITLTWLGKKLGSSIGLICDLKDGLHYFMTSERASVRWDTRFPLNAQSHSVLLQSNDAPCITDYIMDTRRNIWGLVNSRCPGTTKETFPTPIKSRIVRILKPSSVF